MLAMIYALVWILIIAAAGAFYAAGYFSDIALTAFGFLASTLFVGGVLWILPWWTDRRYSR